LRPTFLFVTAFLFCGIFSMAQPMLFISDGQHPVEGVLVEIRFENGSSSTAISGASGELQLPAQKGPLLLKLSHLAFEPRFDTLDDMSKNHYVTLQEKSKQLKDVVVTGQYEAASAHNSVYSVKSIQEDRIRALGAVNLQQILSQELNTRLSYDGALGESGMSLQGISGQNVKILLDGVPMAGREGNNVDLNQINLNNIERIEIVEGPMAINFGANALAGVINLITKKSIPNKWSVRADFQTESVGKSYGRSEGIHNQSLLAGYQINPRWYVQGSMNHHFFGGYKGLRTDRTFEWQPKNQWVGNGLLRYNQGSRSLHYLVDVMDEKISVNGTQEFNKTYAFDTRYHSKRLMQQLVSEGKIFENHRYQVLAGYTRFKRETDFYRNDLFDQSKEILNEEDPQRLVEFNTLNLRGTLTRLKHSRWINYEAGYDIQMEERGGGRISGGLKDMSDYAFFTSAEIKLSPAIKIKPGIRIAYNNRFSSPPWVPALHTRIALDDRSDLRFGIARGYRAPSLRELYFVFFDANHSIRGNENLKPEQSTHLSGSINRNWAPHSSRNFRLELSGFYNRIRDRIGFATDPRQASVLTFSNIDQLSTQGLSLQSQMSYKSIGLNIGAMVIGLNNSIQGNPHPQNNKMLYSPELNSSLSYRWLKHQLSVQLFYKFTGQAPYLVSNPDGSFETKRSGDWHQSDLSISKGFVKNRLQLTAGLRNLFNVTQVASGLLAGAIHSAGPNMLIGYGRSAFVRVTFQLHP
jgi:outer membrane receptor for ferrienterochelin and colicins